MNFAQMLMHGPVITNAPVVKTVKVVPNASLASYKLLSENGIVHSKMIASKTGIDVKSAGKQLRKYYLAGLLDAIGALDVETYNKPIIYRWK